MNLVIDASVLIKLYVPEILSPKADELFNDVQKRNIVLIAPDLIYPETGNILWKKHRLKELSLQEVKEISAAIASFPLTIEPVKPIIQLALDLGVMYTITVYDALYVALSTIYKTKLVTADKKLVTALSKSALKNNIIWLGAYP
ncbi:MAG: type II toxin-antitoxin system VapC family toxin [Proteobacteria bacterium]|nr:type II toxin-antitoxin system VapC family toxin [Pseudomonadota bacterium]